jgi:hypothetical protein
MKNGADRMARAMSAFLAAAFGSNSLRFGKANDMPISAMTVSHGEISRMRWMVERELIVLPTSTA